MLFRFLKRDTSADAAISRCESCRNKKIELIIPADLGLEGGIWDPGDDALAFRLCAGCARRLRNHALRPLELFNLISLHGHRGHLHDDFYDYDTGVAIQAREPVRRAARYPFPQLEDIQDKLPSLIDFAIVQYILSDDLINRLRRFAPAEVLHLVEMKWDYNPGIAHRLFEIVARVLGHEAGEWIRSLWGGEPDELMLFSEALACCLPFEEAFSIVTSISERGDDRFLSRNVSAMLYFRSERTLTWIESVRGRIGNILSDWGQLAASSGFTWQRATQWLDAGRPLSLIALDALHFCTSHSDQLTQSLWLRRINPVLPDPPAIAEMTVQLQGYAARDNVARVRTVVAMVLDSMGREPGGMK